MIDNKGLVSVIVPCYNIEKYAARCFDSILMQTYRNLEIIVVDDGSTDRTPNICDQYKKGQDRIFVLHIEHQGLSAARNRALDVMHGEYAMCVDGDDFIAPDMIERMVLTAERKKAEIVACNYYLYYNENSKRTGSSKKEGGMYPQQAVGNLFNAEERFCSAWAKLYRSELWDNIRYPEDIYFGEDMFVIADLFGRCRNIYFLEEPFYFYNQEGGSLVRSKFNLNKLNLIKACGLWVKICGQKYPEIKRKAVAYYYMNLINMCSNLIDKEYSRYYKRYRKKIITHRREIMGAPLSCKDKMKALLICFASQSIYRGIRNLVSQQFMK